MAGANSVARCPATVRLWASLSDADVSLARSDAHLPVSGLSPEQRERLSAFAAEVKSQASEEEIDGSVIRIWTARLDYGWPDLGTGERLTLVLPDGRENEQEVDLPPPLAPEDRKVLAAQRKADADADVIEVARD
jgi:hypothetical protein